MGSAMTPVNLARRVLQRLYRHRVKRFSWLRLEKIGSDHGGWFVPVDLIQADWICYAGGVGEDITFDLGVIRRFGCQVFAFDPTPRAITYAARCAGSAPEFHFMPVGLWSGDTTLRFFVPRDPAHVSHSVVNLQETDSYFEAPCRSLASLMKELGHDRIDLLKVDVEGAEHEVLRAMLADGIRPTVLCMEIDQPAPVSKIVTTLGRLRRAGYELVKVDAWNFTFLRNEAMPAEAAWDAMT